MQTGNTVIINRSGPSAHIEESFVVVQGRNSWTINPKKDIETSVHGVYILQRHHQVVDFMNGLCDAGLTVVVSQKFDDGPHRGYVHERTRSVYHRPSYLYGLAFGLGTWKNLTERLNRLSIFRRYWAIMGTGHDYASKPWLGRQHQELRITTYFY